MVNKYNYVVIEGNIGAGKTTLATLIAGRFNGHTILERFADNPFLPGFYEDPERYSFSLELSFLTDRFKQLKKESDAGHLSNGFSVADYYFSKSLIFASSTLPPEEYELYRRIYNMVYDSIPKPDLFIYLHRSPELLLKNIKKRGREYEKNITSRYLMKIEESYFSYFRQNPYYKYLIVDAGDANFNDNSNDFEKLIEHIFNEKIILGMNKLVL